MLLKKMLSSNAIPKTGKLVWFEKVPNEHPHYGKECF